MRRFSRFVAALAALESAPAAYADFFAELVPATISQAAREDPTAEADLTNAQSWQLKTTTDETLLYLDLHLFTRSGTLFRHPAYGNTTFPVGPFGPPLDAIFPSAAASSYYHAPSGQQGIAAPDHWIPARPRELHVHAYDLKVNGPLNEFPLVQLTMIPEDGVIDYQLIADFYVSGPDDSIELHTFAYPSSIGGMRTADVNYDFTVDSADLGVIVDHFGATVDESPIRYDVDLDGDFDYYDAGIILLDYYDPESTGQGDINGDGIVNWVDVKIGLESHGLRAWDPADLDDNLQVDGNDFLIWQQQLGNGLPSAAPAAAHATPEPAGLIQLLLSAASLAFARRRRKSTRSS